MFRVSKHLLLAMLFYAFTIVSVRAQEFRREVGTIPVIIKGDTIFNAFDELLSGYTAPALVDIDKDNDVDLFVGGLDGRLHFYRNEGSTAKPRLKLAPLVSAASPIDVGDNSAPTFADIDNDGDFDLFVGEQRGNINFYRNRGTAANPVFVLEAEELAGIRLDFNSTPTFYDLDKDGDLDLFVGGRDGTITLYPNSGTPTNFAFISSVRPFASVDVGFNSAPSFADIDNDGDSDLFVGESDGNIHFYQNNGFAFALVTENFASVDVGAYSTPTFADLDKDGDFDLCVGEQEGSSINFYRNTGGPSTPIFTFVTDNFASVLDFGEHSNPALVDIDKNGNFDWLVGKRNGSMTFCHNIGTAANPAFTVETENFAAINIGSNNAPAFADLDNDGDLDLLVGEFSGNLNFYRNTGTPTNPVFVLETENFGSFNVGLYSTPTFADIDKDGDFDLLVGEADGNINFFRNTGDAANPLFVLATEIFFLIDVGNNSTPAFADLDNDGDLDLLVGESAGNLNFYRNTGTATDPAFTLVTENFASINVGNNSAPAFVDIDKDGDSDLFVGESGGGMHFYRNVTPPLPSKAGIKPVVATPQSIGAEFWVEVAVRNVQNLFGVSFDLRYTNTNFVDVIKDSVVHGPFLGTEVVFISNVNEDSGKVSIGITRKAGQGGVNDSGVVARIKFKSLATTPSGTQVVFCINHVTANDPAGAAIALTAMCDTTTIVGLIVWPGDTNNDGVVNATDVLPIGLHWNKTGPPRQNGSCNWVGQAAAPWSPIAATYADANGDGVVNQADVLCIGLNWSKTHSAAAGTMAKMIAAKTLNRANDPRLCYTITGDTTAGQEFWVNVCASSVTSLFGISFEVLYSPTAYLDPQTTEAGIFLGNDVIFLPYIDKTAGKISIGISQKAPQTGVSGSGVVARIKMKMPANAPSGQAVIISLQNVVANDPSGASVMIVPAGRCTPDIKTGVEESTQSGSTPIAFALLANTPNPFNPSTLIKYELPKQVEVKLVIFDMLGRHVRTLVEQRQQAGRYAAIWDGRNEQGQLVGSGTFLYQLRAGNFVQTRRMALVR